MTKARAEASPDPLVRTAGTNAAACVWIVTDIGMERMLNMRWKVEP